MLVILYVRKSCLMRFCLTRICSLLLIGLLPTCILFSFAMATQIELAWYPNTESDLAGYKIYYGTFARTGTDPKTCGLCGYATVIPVGNVTTYAVTNLLSERAYFFSVTANDQSNNESGFSNEVSGTAINPARTYTYTLATNPSGLQMIVDGAPYNTRQKFIWTPGSSHTISTLSPQSGGTGVQYVYSSWSDGGSQNHTISVPFSNTTYTANFTTQYSLTTTVIPSGAGTLNPSGANWLSSGQNVSVSATANAGYSFSKWSGDLTGSVNPASLSMNGAKSVTANFVPAGSLEVTPSEGLIASGRQGGTFSPSSQTYTLQNGSEKLLKWKVAKKPRWVTVSPMNGSLVGGGTVQVAVSLGTNAKQLKPGAYDDTIVLSNAGIVNDSVSRSITLTIRPAIKSYIVKTNPNGLQIIADGVAYSAPQTFGWEIGSTHTLEAPTPQISSSGTQYVFSSWSNRKPQNQTLVATPSGATYVANFKTQHALTAIVNTTEEGMGGDHAPGLKNLSNTNLPIVGALESPSEGKRVLGLKTIHGWTLDGEGVSSVKLFIDGEYICDIPYGGSREDVREVHPDYPNAERGGFALVWNYSSLSPGAHLVQIEVQNMKGEILSLSANIRVVELSGEMITRVNPGEWTIPEVNLTVDGSTKAYDLRLEWSSESQAFEIIDLYPH